MRGFTLVELSITIAIIIILAVVSAPIYGSLQVRTQLGESSAQIVQALRGARELSVAGYKSQAHGIYLNFNNLGADSYVAYQGLSYAARDTAYDQVFVLEKALSFVNVDLNQDSGDIDINFSQGLGLPNSQGSFKLAHGAQGVKTISINKKGKV